MRKGLTALSAALMVTAGAASAQTYGSPYQAPQVPVTTYPSAVAPVYPTVPPGAAPTAGYPYGAQPPGTTAMPSQPYPAPSYPATSQPYVPAPAYPSAAAGGYGAAPPGSASMPASGMPQALTPPAPVMGSASGYVPPPAYAPSDGVVSNGVMSSEAMQQAQQAGPITGQIQPQTVTPRETRRAARAGGVRRETVTNGPQVDPGDRGGPAAASANQRDDRNYDAMLRSNSGYRSARIQKECGPLQGTGSYDSCVSSFGESAGGGKKARR